MIPAIIAAGAALAAAGAKAYSNYKDRTSHANAVDKAARTLTGAKDNAQNGYNAGVSALNALMDAQKGIYGSPEQVAAGLQSAQQNLDSVSPYQADQFSYDKSLESFYDPAYQLSVNTANDGINQSQALGGNLFSSDTANKLAAQNNVLASNMYKDALSAYQTDKSLEQGIWQGNQSAQQAAAQQQLQLAQAKLDAANNAASNLSGAQNTYYQGLANLGQDLWKNNTDYLGTLAQLYAS